MYLYTIDRLLAHADADAFRGTCNRGRYWDERVVMHRWWRTYLDALRSGEKAAMLR